MVAFGHGMKLFVNSLGWRIKNEGGKRPQTGLPLLFRNMGLS